MQKMVENLPLHLVDRKTVAPPVLPMCIDGRALTGLLRLQSVVSEMHNTSRLNDVDGGLLACCVQRAAKSVVFVDTIYTLLLHALHTSTIIYGILRHYCPSSVFSPTLVSSRAMLCQSRLTKRHCCLWHT
jgi:hypothetical protein